MIKLFTDRLDLSKSEIERFGGLLTATEISQQPEVWKGVAALFQKELISISSFLNESLTNTSQIIFTGAGTSAFIGYSLAGAMFRSHSIPCRVVATTDIVSFPENYFSKNEQYLVISFARSGNSPESIAALELADQFSKKCFHFIITCNENGALTHYSSTNPKKVFILPDAANDKGLAMTSSYSSMLLAALLLIFNTNKGKLNIKKQIELNIDFAQSVLNHQIENIDRIARMDFKRAVFLGSGALYGTATEGALKLQELTDGNVICKSDTFLGFRHGPKAVVNSETLLVYFFSNDPYVRKYEADLLNSMKENTNPLFQLGIGEHISSLDELDLRIQPEHSSTTIDTDFQSLSYILPIQILGFLKSWHLKLAPDSPSSSGAISRVVQGVHIYSKGSLSAI